MHRGRAASTRPSAAARFRLLYPKNRKILAYLREYEGDTHPLRRQSLAHAAGGGARPFANSPAACRWSSMAARCFRRSAQLTYLLTLPPYGFYWFILGEGERRGRRWHTPRTGADARIPDHRHAQELRRGACSTARAASLEREVLPPYLAKRRWFGAEGPEPSNAARIAPSPTSATATASFCWRRSKSGPSGGTARWLLPLGIAWEDEPTAALPQPACPRAGAARRAASAC